MKSCSRAHSRAEDELWNAAELANKDKAATVAPAAVVAPVVLKTTQNTSTKSAMVEGGSVSVSGVSGAACGPLPTQEEEDEDLEEMFIMGPAGMEWGGPTRGGKRPEPTRFGDWERKGRASDF